MNDATRVLTAVRAHLLAVGICLLAGLLGGGIAAYSQSTSWSATSTALVDVPTSDRVTDVLAAEQVSGLLIPSYVQIGQSHAVTDVVAQQLGLSSTRVHGDLQLLAIEHSVVLRFTAVDPSHDVAISIAAAAPQVLADTVARQQGTRSSKVVITPLDVARSATASAHKRAQLVAVGVALGALVGLGLALLLAGRAGDRDAGAVHVGHGALPDVSTPPTPPAAEVQLIPAIAPSAPASSPPAEAPAAEEAAGQEEEPGILPAEEAVPRPRRAATTRQRAEPKSVGTDVTGPGDVPAAPPRRQPTRPRATNTALPADPAARRPRTPRSPRSATPKD